MALSTTDIRDKVKDVLYGAGLGEKPALRTTPTSGNIATVTNKIVTFDLASGEGAKVRAGDVLSIWDAASASVAYSVMVTGVSTDTLTAVNGFDGTVIPNSTDLSNTIWEQRPLVTEANIFKSIETVIAAHLWPQVFDISVATIASPDLVTGQNEGIGDEEEILAAYQYNGPELIPLAWSLDKHTTNITGFTNGTIIGLDVLNGSTVFYRYKEKITAADSSGDDLEELIALGATAHALGGTQVPKTVSSASKDNQISAQRDIAAIVWRDFLTLKQQYRESLSFDTVLGWQIERG